MLNICGLPSLQHSEVRWKIAPLFGHLKTNKNNTKPGVAWYGSRGCKKCYKNTFAAPDCTGGAYSSSPDLLTGLNGPTSTGEGWGNNHRNMYHCTTDW